MMDEIEENENGVISFNAEFSVTNEDIDNIMVSALEGGINYWCERVKVVGAYLGDFASEQISRGGALDFYMIEPYEEDPNGDDIIIYQMDKERFLKGLKLWFINEQPISALMVEDGHVMLDTGDIDGDAADSIIQYALFDEIVYG